MLFRSALFAFAVLLLNESWSHAGHTRPPYVDGCRTQDGRFLVTATYDTAKKQWQYAWQDTVQKKTLTGTLRGLPDGQGHFTVAYVHLFVAPDGETFAAWNPCSWAGNSRDLGKIPERMSSEFQDYPGFADRLVIYKKTGEIVKRLHMKDFYDPGDWDYVHWVQGNLYWLAESPDWPDSRNGEPPRVGYRYYRVSPDYTVLEVAIGPDRELQAKHSVAGKKLEATRRVVRIDLRTGDRIAAHAKLGVEQTPVRPFLGPMIRRGEEMKNYLPSLDPVRVQGNSR
jgi:hypothetical protein